MNLNRKVGILLDCGLTPEFIASLNENTINVLYERMSKKENKEGVEKITKVTTKITPDTAKKGATIEMPAGKTAVSIQQKPDGSIEIAEDMESDLDWVMKGRTQQPKQVGPDTDDGFDDYDDGTGQISEKFESKAQQGLFWARCNKCKSENCKWCKMAKEFSKSTSKKQYKNMPEKKHPEKTVKYKKKETKEEFTFKDYLGKLGSAYTAGMAKNVKGITPRFNESVFEKNLSDIIEENLKPTMKKRDLLKLIESEIKNKKGLNEDFYMSEMDEELDFDFMSDVETAPIIKPKIKPKTPETEPEWSPDEDEPVVPSPNVDPEPQAASKKEKNRLSKVERDQLKRQFYMGLSRMDESTYKPINYRKF
jgi:hypothetical protein